MGIVDSYNKPLFRSEFTSMSKIRSSELLLHNSFNLSDGSRAIQELNPQRRSSSSESETKIQRCTFIFSGNLEFGHFMM